MQINGLTVLISGNYNVFNEGWNGAGVYVCSGNYTSEVFKQPIYIGSAIDLQKRIEYGHISLLEKNKHKHSDVLQFSWNKHNEKDGFVWFLLETCQPCETLILEQKYLDIYRPFIDEFGGFNICHFATAPMQGRHHTDEARKKISDAGRNRKWTDEQKRKASERMTGRKLSDETKEKLRIFNTGIVRKPESEKKRYQKKIGPRPPVKEETKRKISQTLTGKFTGENHWSYGKQHSEEHIAKIVKSCHYFNTPDGTKIKIDNLKRFCRENNLNDTAMYAVSKGNKKQYKGWTKCIENL